MLKRKTFNDLYKLIAKVIRNAKENLYSLEELVQELAMEFKKNNPRFDVLEFSKECGFEKNILLYRK